MKKITAVILLFSCLFALCSCTRSGKENSIPDSVSTTVLNTVYSDPEHKEGEVYTYIPSNPEEVLNISGLKVYSIYYNSTEKIDQFLTKDMQSRVKTFYYDANGKIRSISVEIYSDGVASTLAEYDAKGNLEKVYVCSVLDKESGNPLLKYCYNAKGELTEYIKYEYDEEGNPLRDSYYLPDDTFTGFVQYEYGKDDYTEYKYDENRKLTGYTVYGYSEDSINYTRTEYDANGKKITAEK